MVGWQEVGSLAYILAPSLLAIAVSIAEGAERFGQEDDIAVLTLTCTA